MCAFGILALITSTVMQIWHENMDKANRAVSRRVLREVADSCFRRILYEIQQHDDGMTANVADFYARDWLKLEGRQADRYRFYSLRLEKKLKAAAGASTDDDAEPLFGDGEAVGTSGSGDDDDEGAEGAGSINLIEVTLHLYFADEGDDKPLLTLKTYIPQPESTE